MGWKRERGREGRRSEKKEIMWRKKKKGKGVEGEER